MINTATPPVPARDGAGPERNPFRELWDLGYRKLVPIVPPAAKLSERSSLFKRPGARGKAPGVRGRDGLWMGFDWITHDCDEHDLDR